MEYKDAFVNTPVESKRADLLCNPLFNKEAIANASDEEIIEAHRVYFEVMNESMLETIGESIYD